MADWAGGQCSPSVLPFTEYSGVLPSVMSKVRKTRNSSASYSKNSSAASREGTKTQGQHVFFFVFFLKSLHVLTEVKEQMGGKQQVCHSFAYPVTYAGGDKNHQKATCIDTTSTRNLIAFVGLHLSEYVI